MSRDMYVTIENVDIGVDSNSGAAVSIEINGEHHWVPYSQIKALHRDTKVHGNDKFEVKLWLAEKNGWIE